MSNIKQSSYNCPSCQKEKLKTITTDDVIRGYMCTNCKSVYHPDFKVDFDKKKLSIIAKKVNDKYQYIDNYILEEKELI